MYLSYYVLQYCLCIYLIMYCSTVHVFTLLCKHRLLAPIQSSWFIQDEKSKNEIKFERREGIESLPQTLIF